MPISALENTSKAVLDLNGIGQSIMEVSHRSKDFQKVFDEAVDLIKELLEVPEGYSVLFLGGGASTQFAMIAMNFLKKKGAYLNTGTWSTKAIQEAELYGKELVDVVASSKDKGFNYIPKGYTIPADADYFHITTNNTIKGTEIHEDMDCPVPLIADMSSDFMSRPVDVSKYVMIYGGAQKNLGPAGVTFVIIKDSFLDNLSDRMMPTMMRYKTHIDKDSMFNTPPVTPIFVVREVCKWLKDFGGLKEMQKYNIEKAGMLYDAIDNSKMFKGTVAKEDRSLMNICFVMEDKYKALEADFISFAGERDCVGIKGHRSVGGFRASTYNACTKEDVAVLIKAMADFEAKNA